MSRVLIINADDFGLDKDTNSAIVEAFKMKLCSSTTIMANGIAFDDAVMLAKDNGLLGRIGLHINLSEFNPLTSNMKSSSLFCCEDGTFNKAWKSQHKSGVLLDKSLRRLVADEVKAQIERCLNEGIKLTHVDSHIHIHTLPGICKVICNVAKQYNINKIRLSRNCGLIGATPHKKLYKYLFNRRLRFAGFKTTEYFGSIDDIKILLDEFPDILTSKSVEIMCHPRKMGDDTVDLNGLSLKDQILGIEKYDKAVSYLEL